MITATVVISFLSFFTLGLPDGLLGVAWPTVRGEFGQPVGAIAFLLASGSMGYLLSSTSIGRIIRRIGLANAIVGGSASIAAGLALIATAVSWWFILPGYFLIGFGGGLVDAGFNAYAADHFDATTMNWMHACFGIGATVGPSMMTLSLLRTGSWRPAYLVSSLFIVLVTALILRFRHRISGAAGGTRHPTEPVAPPAGHDLPASATADIDREGDLPAGRDPRWLSTWGGVAVFFLYTGIEVSTGQLGFTLLVEGRGVDPVRAGFWVSAFWLALTVGRILLGPLSHRVGSRRVLRGAFALAVTAALLLMLNLHPTLDGLSLALMGFALASIFPLMTLLTSERVGAARAHDVIGYQMGAATVGVVLLSGGGGVLAGKFGVALIGPYIFVLTLLCAGLFILTAMATATSTAAKQR